jgi:transcriptional regulator with XRE-family HTH domain
MRNWVTNMAKAKGRIAQPKGGKITVGPDERTRLKELREKKGLGQKELALKIGVTQGTISNLESGRHPQMTKLAYASLVKALGTDAESMTNEEAYQRLVRAASTLGADQLAVAAATIEALAAPKKKP